MDSVLLPEDALRERVPQSTQTSGQFAEAGRVCRLFELSMEEVQRLLSAQWMPARKLGCRQCLGHGAHQMWQGNQRRVR